MWLPVILCYQIIDQPAARTPASNQSQRCIQASNHKIETPLPSSQSELSASSPVQPEPSASSPVQSECSLLSALMQLTKSQVS